MHSSRGLQPQGHRARAGSTMKDFRIQEERLTGQHVIQGLAPLSRLECSGAITADRNLNLAGSSDPRTSAFQVAETIDACYYAQLILGLFLYVGPRGLNVKPQMGPSCCRKTSLTCPLILCYAAASWQPLQIQNFLQSASTGQAHGSQWPI
ncbi:PREDICTED: uncharacterized protein LOC105593302 isoform X1 [Cercocebus atys]|uniref:uncharacterized protein LOC105593302 isoform X1 n=1 Tax=Cercocebus atys TaxID=9531 RepID=UPI0005F4CD0D|nr:PREDICTED: uncharacterized protein LOC105593302 isoform X1 [Cercocebus atys]